MADSKLKAAPQKAQIVITPPNFAMAEFILVGTAPFVQLRFSEKAKQKMKENMMAGSKAKKGKKREPRDFEADYQAAFHISEKGWYGQPASAYRSAMISACRVVGFTMTRAKLALFVIADGVDAVDGTPLVKIEGTPEPVEHLVKPASGGADIRVRAMWREWRVRLRIEYDADMFSLQDVLNLLLRVGRQVGIGEGRPDSKSSSGMGWGTFRIDLEGKE